jgi:hypothetical protein
MSQLGYYALDKDEMFTENSPYRYKEDAIAEAKEIHGDSFDHKKHIEEHITDKPLGRSL